MRWPALLLRLSGPRVLEASLPQGIWTLVLFEGALSTPDAFTLFTM